MSGVCVQAQNDNSVQSSTSYVFKEMQGLRNRAKQASLHEQAEAPSLDARILLSAMVLWDGLSMFWLHTGY